MVASRPKIAQNYPRSSSIALELIYKQLCDSQNCHKIAVTQYIQGWSQNLTKHL